MNTAFDRCDIEGDGQILKWELRQTLERDGFNLTDFEFEECWGFIDKEDGKVIHYSDFEKLYHKTKRSDMAQLRDKLLATPSFYASCCYLGSAFSPFFIKDEVKLGTETSSGV